MSEIEIDSTIRDELNEIVDDQRDLLIKGKVPPYAVFVAGLFKQMSRKMETLLHAVVGISGESGEVLDLVKKSWAYNKPLDRMKMIEELGDQRFYYQAALNTLGITDEQVRAYNKRKLLLRYPQGYSDAAAQARADIVVNDGAVDVTNSP